MLQREIVEQFNYFFTITFRKKKTNMFYNTFVRIFSTTVITF